MKKSELINFLEQIEDDAEVFFDTDEECLVFVENGNMVNSPQIPQNCNECENTGLVDIDPGDVPHGTEGYWVNKHGARFFMAYCHCYAGEQKRSEHDGI